MPNVRIIQDIDVNDFVTNTWRPCAFDKNGKPYISVNNQKRLVSNAFLNQEEWETLDKQVFEMAKLRMNGIADLQAAGLSKRTTLATWHTKWRVASERVGADVTMDFRSRRNQDRTDKKTYGVPLPIYSCEYALGRREILTARATGTQIESFEAGEAGQAVAEKAEEILFSGETGVVVQGNSISGYTTLAARDTATAAAYGGGDFGTITNIYNTFLGMLSALAAKRYHGPFVGYIAQTQYSEMLQVYTDGSGQTALDRVKGLPQIKDVKASDFLSAGNLVLVQMTADVVDLMIAMTLENRRWEAPDGSEMFFVAMMSVVPRLKTDYAGNAGIAHATSC